MHVNWKLNLFLYGMFKTKKNKTVVLNCDDAELRVLTMKNACVSWLKRNMSNVFCDEGNDLRYGARPSAGGLVQTETKLRCTFYV